eukprot:CAMPEP_0114687674 /NCGR_PEP_ID=MMETSP0191-20121206/62752_1 /TAXON_ID=126664 /ORGANISM="Sorites sp." /LENGTH=34 /DNA_ID= /DNA_START= /DNA_END= /DNA_ORIENTATION=
MVTAAESSSGGLNKPTSKVGFKKSSTNLRLKPQR